MREPDDSAEGMGRSLIDVSREAVVGKDVAQELIMATSSGVVNVVGKSSGLSGGKRSGYVASSPGQSIFAVE